MEKLKPCPVCGKKPKVKMEHYPTGCLCKIYCKPIFRKSHLETFHGAALEERAFRMAVEDWNRGAE